MFIIVTAQSFICQLPHDKSLLDLSKLKKLADDKLKVAHMVIFVSEKKENIEGKRENAGYQHFLLFPQCFQKASSSRMLKHWIVWSRVYLTFLGLYRVLSFNPLPEDKF